METVSEGICSGAEGVGRNSVSQEEIDLVEWPNGLCVYGNYNASPIQTSFNRELQAYPKEYIPVHFLSRTKFTEFSWKQGDVIMFEENIDDLQPIAWRVDGDQWLRIKWVVGDEKYQQAINLKKFICKVVDGALALGSTGLV